MSGQSWVVGATSECDIVVSEPIVSGRHCQITRTADGVVLRDLGSTNGTYVNGERISSPRRVRPSDRITLGTTVQLPWPSHLLSPGSRTVRIGRSANNQVVIHGEGVADHHAQLTLHDGILTLEDLGSPTGTALGSPDQQITRTAVKAGDTIFLGSTAVPVASLVRVLQSGAMAVVKSEPGSKADSPPRDKKRMSETGTLIAVAAGGAVLMALLVALIVLATGGGQNAQDGDRGDVVAQGDPVTSGEGGFNASAGQRPEADEGENARLAEGTSAQPRSKTVSSQQLGATPAARPSDSLLLVLVGEPAGKFYRVGTAWAVEPTRLVSSASVVMRIEALRERFPQVVVFSPLKSLKIPVLDTTVHPQYKQAAADCDAAEKELERLLAQQDTTPPADIDRAELREAWLEARMRAFKAAERQVYYDAATMNIGVPVEPVLTLAPLSNSDALRPNLAVRVMGLAFDFKDPFFDPATATMPWTLDARIGKLVSFEVHEPARGAITHASGAAAAQPEYSRAARVYLCRQPDSERARGGNCCLLAADSAARDGRDPGRAFV